jgi:hypothetical protein
VKTIIEKLKNEETIRQLRAALWSYLRAAIASVGAMLLAGIDDPAQITLSALLGGILGPLIKALDPNQDEYGIGAKVEAAIKTEDSASSE